MRDAFNFYRSYAKVAARLSDEDRLAFYDALMMKQFSGKDPIDLPTMALFAYESQKHSIDKQVVGYEKAKNTILSESEGSDILPTPLPPKGSPTIPRKEVKEEVKEKVKEQHMPSEDEFIAFAKEYAKKYSKDEDATVVQVRLAHENYLRAGWKDAHGNKISNWKNKLTNGYLLLEKLPPRKLNTRSAIPI